MPLKNVLGQVQALIFPKDDPLQNRRSENRIACDFTVLCGVGNQDNLEGRILDLGTSGMRIRVPVKLKRRQEIRVSALPGSGTQGRQRLKCQVAWARESGDPGWIEAGLRYADSPDNLATSWVQFTLRRYSPGAGARKDRRVEAGVPVELHNLQGQPLGEGTILDLSLGGAMISMERTIPEGQTVRVRLEGPGDGGAIFLLARVVGHQVGSGAEPYLLSLCFFPADKTEQQRLRSLLLALLDGLRHEPRARKATASARPARPSAPQPNDAPSRPEPEVQPDLPVVQIAGMLTLRGSLESAVSSPIPSVDLERFADNNPLVSGLAAPIRKAERSGSRFLRSPKEGLAGPLSPGPIAPPRPPEPARDWSEYGPSGSDEQPQPSQPLSAPPSRVPLASAQPAAGMPLGATLGSRPAPPPAVRPTPAPPAPAQSRPAPAAAPTQPPAGGSPPAPGAAPNQPAAGGSRSAPAVAPNPPVARPYPAQSGGVAPTPAWPASPATSMAAAPEPPRAPVPRARSPFAPRPARPLEPPPPAPVEPVVEVRSPEEPARLRFQTVAHTHPLDELEPLRGWAAQVCEEVLSSQLAGFTRPCLEEGYFVGTWPAQMLPALGPALWLESDPMARLPNRVAFPGLLMGTRRRRALLTSRVLGLTEWVHDTVHKRQRLERRLLTPSELVHHFFALLALGGDGAVSGGLRCCRVAVETCRHLGVSDPLILHQVKAGALLHDLGEAAVLMGRMPRAWRDRVAYYLNSIEPPPEGDYTNLSRLRVPSNLFYKVRRPATEDLDLLRCHPLLSEEILIHQVGLARLAPIVRSCHERWDGGGYPDGLRGEQIPAAARCLAVADMFSTLVGEEFSVESAAAQVRAGSGSYFDPAVVKAFMSFLHEVK